MRIEFEGGICEVMAHKSGTPRAVFLVNKMTPHLVEIFLPLNPDVTPAAQKKEIEDVTGLTAQPISTKGFRLSNVKGWMFRIVDPTGSGSPMQPALTPSLDFDFLVPHLSRVAGVTEADLDPGIDKDPDASGKFVDFVELDGGVLSAVPYCKRGVFDPDTEKRSIRAFAQTVVLTGSTAATAVLQMRKTSRDTWQSLHFGSVDLVRITFRNQPASSDGMPHFDMHKNILNSGSTLTWPDIPPGQIVEFCPQSDTVPGCSDTQWP
ncbi:MAG TPA: hypothetical protein VNN25_02215 [Thermoanaerobaculia bacterium]|nr:hypothetical protein [Thermoanaerobaculia bacterium]